MLPLPDAVQEGSIQELINWARWSYLQEVTSEWSVPAETWKQAAAAIVLSDSQGQLAVRSNDNSMNKAVFGV